MLRGEYIEKITNYDNFNEIEVNKRKDNPWDVIFLEFVDSCQMLANAFLKIPKDLENLRIWSDTDITPKTWLKMDINHMRGEHLAQLRRTK